jgi:hypothetical protein
VIHKSSNGYELTRLAFSSSPEKFLRVAKKGTTVQEMKKERRYIYDKNKESMGKSVTKAG